MRKLEVDFMDIIHDDLDDLAALTASGLDLAVDLPREGLEEDDDDLGFRTLYEHPEIVLDPRRTPRAA